MPGLASTIARTALMFPNMVKVKSVGRPPCFIKTSTISGRPTWEAAPMADSQSPNPQSHDALANAGRAVTSFLTRSRSKWENFTKWMQDADLLDDSVKASDAFTSDFE